MSRMPGARAGSIAGLALAWSAAMLVTLHSAARDGSQGPGAPAFLSETGLYEPGRPGAIARGIRPYSPQYPLWTDGATKARWIYLPPGTSIDTSAPGDWTFPVGTRLWKEFSFNGRKVETRLLWRTAADRWIFASYAWNAEQTEAALAPNAGIRHAVEIAPGRFHDIPGVADCGACHGTERPGPLGFNALQLSTDRDPNAIHGEPLAPGMTSLVTLQREGLLSPARPEWIAEPPRIRTANPETRAILGYFAGNCGHCHNASGDTTYRGPSLRLSDVTDGDAVARALLAQTTVWQVPGRRDGTTRMLDAHAPDASAMLYRMRSRSPSSQMPPLGTVLRDEAAIAALTKWIAAAPDFTLHSTARRQEAPSPRKGPSPPEP